MFDSTGIDAHLSQLLERSAIAPTTATCRPAAKMPRRGPAGGVGCEILRAMARSERGIYDPGLKFDYRDSHVDNSCRVKMVDWIAR